MGPRATRGDGRVCRGRRGPPHRAIGRLRRELWSRQPAPDQRALRLPPQPGSGPGHRRADPQRRDRQRLLPGDPSRASLRRVQPLLRAGVPARADAARPRDRHPDRAVAARGLGDRPARRRGPARGRRAARRACLSASRSPRVCPSDDEIAALAKLLNALGEDHHPRRRGLRGRARGADRSSRASSRRRSCTRCAARSSSSTTTRSTSA